ncbi:MAG: hypothetical protein KGL39_22645 [Patescibacteria group bacterium]|nr:hypothetical protein [Patescibacteria group bacterium]
MRLGPLTLFERQPLAAAAPAAPTSTPTIAGSAVTDELGRSGIPIFGGRIYDEFLPALQGYRAAKVYREMWMNDPVVSAIWFAVDMLIRQVSWHVEPGGDSPQDQEAADFLESCRGDMSSTWEDFISEVLSMLIFGYAPMELVYKWRRGPSQQQDVPSSQYNDGRMGWRKIALRSQETIYRWEIDDNGGVQGLIQVAPPHYQEQPIPIERLLLFRTLVYDGSPQGRSIIRSAYRPWLFKKRIEEIEGIGIERDLAGLPVLHVPAKIMLANASAAEKAILSSMKTLVTNIRRDAQEGVILPQQYDDAGHPLYDLKLLATGGQRNFDTNAIIARYDQRIAMSVMADFILLGHEAVGSKALGMSKIELFTAALQAWVNSIAAVINRHGVARLFALNRFQVEKLPEIRPADVEEPDLQELGNYIQALSLAGMPLFPDGNLEDYLRNLGGLPERPDDEPTGPPEQTPQPHDQQPPEPAPAGQQPPAQEK